MKDIAALRRVKVSADGRGVMSHAGMGLLRELADLTGLSAQVTDVLADTYKGPWTYAPGAVFADLAAAVADGADCIDGVGQLCGDREHVFGAKASTTTMWRLVDQRIDAVHLPKVRGARAAARAAAWAAGAAPPAGRPLYIDIDATLVIDHSDNKSSTIPTTNRMRRRRGRSPSAITRCWRSWTARKSPAGRPWPGCYGLATPAPSPPPTTSPSWSRPLPRCQPIGVPPLMPTAGRRWWCAATPPGPPTASPPPAVSAVSGSPSGFPSTPGSGTRWTPSTSPRAGTRPSTQVVSPRDGAWVAEATALVNLATWPAGTRLILRKERPHPGAQLRFTDIDGMRITAFITDTPPAAVPGQLAGLELRHRQHARVEDRIRQAKAAGLTNLPCHSFTANAAWLEIVLAAADLVAWAQLIGFTDAPELARAEIAAFRYRVLHVAARTTRGARQLHLRIDATWRWAAAIATAWQRLRAAFP